VKDFITRIAERALGTAPRIVPQATSRYAPAHLPLPQSRWSKRAARLAHSPNVLSAAGFEIEEASKEEITNTGTIAAQADLVTITPGDPRHPRHTATATIASDKPEPLSRLTHRTSTVAANESRVSSEQHLPADDSRPSFVEASATGKLSDYSSHAGNLKTSEMRQAKDVVTTPAGHDLPSDALKQNAASANDQEKNKNPAQVALGLRINELIATDSPEIIESSETVADRALIAVQRPESTNDFTSTEALFPADSELTVHPQITREEVPANRVRPVAAISGESVYERPQLSESNIQVRIGRIEVRAEPVPRPAAEPVNPPTPKVSLAEFLSDYNRSRA
jgi:hypothetical protein